MSVVNGMHKKYFPQRVSCPLLHSFVHVCPLPSLTPVALLIVTPSLGEAEIDQILAQKVPDYPGTEIECFLARLL